MKKNKSKNIGILTLYPTFNYGGILQSVALYHILESIGYSPRLIYRPTQAMNMLNAFKQKIKFIIARIPGQNYKNAREDYLKEKFHRDFILKWIPYQTEKIQNQKQLFEVCKKYQLDTVIVGSDQVWRMDYIRNDFYANYFLDFVPDDIKKIAFSASFGKDEWEESIEVTESVKKLITRFDAISMREDSGVGLCKNVLNFPSAIHTLDPTMLVDSGLYDSMIQFENLKPLPEKTLVTYILDKNSNKEAMIHKIKEERGLSSIKHLHGFANSKKEKTITVGEWLNALKTAEFIVTDSFHGTVFSIIFKKQFLVIKNEERGAARFDSLERTFSPYLSNVITSESNVSSENLKTRNVSYSLIDELINKEKISANYFLTKNLL